MSCRIVIADDHPVVLAGIRELIDQDARFFVVGQASSPAGLVRALHEHQPDVLVTDFCMPAGAGMSDGFGLIARLKVSFPDIPVVVLTVISAPWMVNEMYRVGAFGVVAKTNSPHALIAALVAARLRRQGRCNALSWPDSFIPVRQIPMCDLSPRELEIARRLFDGQSVSEIAVQLNRSKSTVSAQKASVMRKLGARNDHELLALKPRLTEGLTDTLPMLDG